MSVSFPMQNGPSSDKDLAYTKDITSNNSPSHNASSGIPKAPDSSLSKETKIHAFRTITNLLAQIQQEWPLRITDLDANKNLLTDDQRQELKLSNAFATLAVIDHEIIAVATKRSTEALEVLTAAQASNNKGNTPRTRSGVRKLWNILTTQNAHQTHAGETIDPIIHDVENMPDVASLNLVDDNAIRKYVQNHWSSTLPQHLWILGKLLVMKDGPSRNSQDITDLILPYVIATCCPKMLRRLANKTVSQPLINCLKEIKPPRRFNKSTLDQPQSKDEHENDWQFLLEFILRLPNVKKSYPKLREQAVLAQNGQDFQLYTKHTRREFHAVLVMLLQRYQASLARLVDLRKTLTEVADNFKIEVDFVKMCGYALQKLAKGAALHMHLQTITLLWPCTPPPAMGSEDSDDDSDISEVLPSVSTGVGVVAEAPWKSFIDWLRLMIAHFDAVPILVGYVTGTTFHHEVISIQYLVVPSVGQQLLPWRKLFTHSKLFPTETPFSFQVPIDKTNNKILDFLEDSIKTPAQADHLRGLWIQARRGNGNLKGFVGEIKKLENLENSTSPGWKNGIKELRKQVEEYQDNRRNSSADEVSKTIEALSNSTRFFKFLDSKILFLGTLHCEASVTSFLDEATMANNSMMERMKGFGPVIGVSRRCCPVCQRLLELLGQRIRQPFIVRGSHNTVTACSLPKSLPEDIMDSMNNFFGHQLRQELVKLMSSSSLLRKRVKSTGSERLSSDSTAQEGDSVPKFTEKSFQSFLEPEQ